MRFSLGQLEAFYWTARLGSMRSAASQLNLTQPTLSLRIKELERLMGVALFDRTRRGLRLTVHGAAIRRHAEQVLAVAKEIEAYARAESPNQILLRIGAADYFAATCLPKLLRVFEESYPNIKVEVSVAFSQAVCRMLLAGEVDVAFLTNVEPHDELITRKLGHIPVTWMAPPEMGMSDRPVRPADLANHHIITNPAPSHLYRSIHEWFAAAGVWPTRVSVCNTLSVIAQLSSEGFGVAMLPVGMVQFDPWARRLRVLGADPAIEPHHLYSAYKREQASSGVEQVVDEAASIVAGAGLFVVPQPE